MTFLKNLFQSSETRCLKQAERLLPAANIVAISSYTRVRKEFPILETVRPDDWDFFVTVGAIYVALTQLNSEPLKESLRERMADVVSRDALNWDGQAADAFDDCKALVEEIATALDRGDTPEQLRVPDALGFWIATNVFRHTPTEAEAAIARPVGVLLLHSFLSWWKA